MTITYDVFLSHASADKPEVEALARRLREDGFEPFLDIWHLVPGEPWQEALEDALEVSRTCAVFVGAELGPWQNEEMRAALAERTHSADFRVIPVLLPGALKPNANKLRFLRRLTWVDFRDGLDGEDAYHRLVCGIRGVPPNAAATTPREFGQLHRSAPDLSWLWLAFSSEQPLQLVFGAARRRAVEPQLEHHLVALLEKFSRLLSPIVHPAELPYVDRARETLGLDRPPTDRTPTRKPLAQTFVVLAGDPPAGILDVGTLSGARIAATQQEPQIEGLRFARCPDELALYLILARSARHTGRWAELLDDLNRIPPVALRRVRSYQARYWPECEAEPITENSPALPLLPPVGMFASSILASPDIRLDRIAKALSEGDTPQTRAHLEDLGEPAASTPQQQVRLANLKSQVALLDGDVEEAAEQLRSAFERVRDPGILANLAMLQAREGRDPEARALLSTMSEDERSIPLKLARAVTEAWAAVRRSPHHGAKVEVALAPLEELARSTTTVAGIAAQELATLYALLGQLPTASQHLERALASGPDSIELLLQRALLLLRQLPQSTAELSSSLASQGHIDRIPNQAITQLEDLRRRTASQGGLRVRMTIEHALGVARHYAGLATQQRSRAQEHFVQAAEAFARAGEVEADPDLVTSQAGCWLLAGDPSRARDVYESLPEYRLSPAARANLVALQLRAGEIDLALMGIQRLIDDAKIPSPTFANLGIFLLACGKASEALEAFELARLGAGANRGRIDFLRGRALDQLDQLGEAEDAFRSALGMVSYDPRFYAAHLEAFERSTSRRLSELQESLARRLEALHADGKLLVSLEERLRSLRAGYREKLSLYQRVRIEPQNALANLFAPLLAEADRLRRLADQLADLSEECELDAPTLVSRLKEALGESWKPSFGAAVAPSPQGTSTDWLAIHRSFTYGDEEEASAARGVTSDIRFDDRSAEVLKSLAAGVSSSLTRQWLHLAGRRFETEMTTESLSAYDHVDGVQRKSYQQAAVERAVLRNYGRVLLADEVGLGKTIVAGLILTEYRIRGLVHSCLILVPSRSLGLQWCEEFAEKFRLSPERSGEIAMYGTHRWRSPDEQLVSVFTRQGALARKKALLTKSWDLVIVDEAHHLRNRSTHIFRFVQKLRSRHLLLLTATPLQNRIEDLYSLASLIQPNLLGTLSSFRAAYIDASNTRGMRLRDPAGLAERLSTIMIRNRAVAVVGELKIGRRKFEDDRVPLTPDERRFYQDVESLVLTTAARETARGNLPISFYTLLKAACSSPQAALKSLEGLLDKASEPGPLRLLQRLCRTAAELTPTAKLAAVRRQLELVGKDRVVLFTEFRKTARLLTRHLDALWIDARTDDRSRTAQLVDFLTGRGPQVLVATPYLSEGLNLQSCRHIINFDLPWNPFKIEQRIGRIHRFGQTADEIRIVSLSAADTIEDKIRQLLIDKLKLFELIVGRQSLQIFDLGSGRSFESRLRRLITQARSLQDIDLGLERLADDETLIWAEESSSRRPPSIRQSLLVLNEHLDQLTDREPA